MLLEGAWRRLTWDQSLGSWWKLESSSAAANTVDFSLVDGLSVQVSIWYQIPSSNSCAVQMEIGLL